MTRERPLDDEEELLDEEESVFEDGDDWVAEEVPLYGPDDRDADLLDGSWEQRHYRGQTRQFNWEKLYALIAALLILSLVLPVILIAR